MTFLTIKINRNHILWQLLFVFAHLWCLSNIIWCTTNTVNSCVHLFVLYVIELDSFMRSWWCLNQLYLFFCISNWFCLKCFAFRVRCEFYTNFVFLFCRIVKQILFFLFLSFGCFFNGKLNGEKHEKMCFFLLLILFLEIYQFFSFDFFHWKRRKRRKRRKMTMFNKFN